MQAYIEDLAPEIPRYQCHKKVRAFKVNRVEWRADGAAFLVGKNKKGQSIKELVSPDYMKKHLPAAGGYYVQYNDNYASWSPTEAFEEGYSLIND